MTGRSSSHFTGALEVIAHELTHGITQFTAQLPYQGEQGALNESFSDVFGSLVKQWAAGQSVAQADWLIGNTILAPGIQGRALRDMANPGTAYDDPCLGKDPQPGHMSGYVQTEDDNGGVHINSGIPEPRLRPRRPGDRRQCLGQSPAPSGTPLSLNG